eukprot:scaffold107333_cov51-Phaeocystis_antarctica.AAC.2
MRARAALPQRTLVPRLVDRDATRQPHGAGAVPHVRKAEGAAVQQLVRGRPLRHRRLAAARGRLGGKQLCGKLGRAGEVGELALRKLNDDRLGLLLPAPREGLGLVEPPPQVVGGPPELGHLPQLHRHRLRLPAELVALLAHHGQLRLRLRAVRRVFSRCRLERRSRRLRRRPQLLLQCPACLRLLFGQPFGKLRLVRRRCLAQRLDTTQLLAVQGLRIGGLAQLSRLAHRRGTRLRSLHRRGALRRRRRHRALLLLSHRRHARVVLRGEPRRRRRRLLCRHRRRRRRLRRLAAQPRLHGGEGLGLLPLHRLERGAHLGPLHLLQRLPLARGPLRRLACRLRSLHLGLGHGGGALLGEQLVLPPLPLALRLGLRGRLLLLLLPQPLLLRALEPLTHRGVGRHRPCVAHEVAQPPVDLHAEEAARCEGHTLLLPPRARLPHAPLQEDLGRAQREVVARLCDGIPVQLEHAHRELPDELTRAGVAPYHLGPTARACEQPLERVRTVEVAEELLEQQSLGVARLAHLCCLEHATALQLLPAQPLVELEGSPRAVGFDTTDEVALALVEGGDQAVHLVAELERDTAVLREGRREEVASEVGVTVGTAVRHQGEQLLVEGVNVTVAEPIGAVGHRRAEVLDREAAAGERLAIEWWRASAAAAATRRAGTSAATAAWGAELRAPWSGAASATTGAAAARRHEYLLLLIPLLEVGGDEPLAPRQLLRDLLSELLVPRASARPPVVTLLEARIILQQREHAVRATGGRRQLLTRRLPRVRAAPLAIDAEGGGPRRAA